MQNRYDVGVVSLRDLRIYKRYGYFQSMKKRKSKEISIKLEPIKKGLHVIALHMLGLCSFFACAQLFILLIV